MLYEVITDDIMISLKEETKRSQELFIKHFKDEYHTTDLPLWTVVEVISFGTLSKVYSILKTEEQESVISSRITSYNVCYTKLLRILFEVSRNFSHSSSKYAPTPLQPIPNNVDFK